MKPVCFFCLIALCFSLMEDTCDKGADTTQCSNCDGDKCKACNKGDFIKDGQCINCINGPSNCKNCELKNGKILCSDCFDGTYLKADKCEICYKSIPNCNKCTLSGDKVTCSQCFSGYHLQSDNTCVHCKEKACIACNSNKDSCDKCEDKYYYLDENRHSCIHCMEGCEKCNSTGCSSCENGYYLNSTTCAKGNIEHCLDYSSYDKCKQCENEYYLNEKKTKCEKSSITNCLSSEYDSKEGEICNLCKDGFLLENNQCSICLNANCICQETTNTCPGCVKGFFKKTEQDTCTGECKTQFDNCLECNRYKCTKCEEGFIIKNYRCVKNSQMVDHCIIYTDEDGCIKCEDGYPLNGNSKCSSGFLKYSVMVILVILLLL